MKPTASSRLIRVLAIVLLFVGHSCIAIRQDKASSVAQWPPPPVENPRAAVVEVTGNVIGGLKTAWENCAVHALRESRQCSEVGTGSRVDAPLRLVVKVGYAKTIERGALALSGFTLFVLPVRAGRATINLSVDFYCNGRFSGNLERKATVVVWQQLFLLFVAPFLREERIYTDMLRSAIAEAVSRDMMLDARAP